MIIDASFDATPVAGHHVNVAGAVGGLTSLPDRLYVYDSEFRALNPSKRPHLSVQSDGVFHFIRSTITDFRDIGVDEGGGDQLIQDSVLQNVEHGIITLPVANLRVLGNLIDGSRYAAFQVQGTPRIENNTIVNCGIGITFKFDDARPKVFHNTITSCDAAGILQDQSAVGGHVLQHNDIYGINNPRWNAVQACVLAAFYGNGQHSWWGKTPPDPACFGSDVDYSNWKTEPVHPERLPRPVIGAPSGPGGRNQPLTFDAANSAPSTKFGFPLAQFTWDFGDGMTGSGPRVAHAYTSPGTYAVTLTVKDTKGLSRSTTSQVSIVNHPPTISSIAIAPSNPMAGQELSATVQTTDQDGDAVSLSYQWTRNDQAQTDLTTAVVPGSRVRSGDAWHVSATPRDSQAAGASATASTVVGNRAPSITLLTLGPENPTRETGLQSQIMTTDDDGDPITVSYQWTRNGQTQTSQTTANLPGNVLTKGDRWAARATANDGHLDSQTVETDATIQNAKPRATSVAFAPAQPTAANDLVASPQGLDADGDLITWTYEWQRNGVVDTTALHATLPKAKLVRGDQWSVTATPNDGTPGSSVSAQTLVQNAPPRLVSKTASPSSPRTGEPVTLHLETEDADDDALTYQWILPDGTTRAGNDPRITFNTAGTKNIYYEVRDGHTGAASGALTVTVTTPPITTSTTTTPPSSSTTQAPTTWTAASTPQPSQSQPPMPITTSAQSSPVPSSSPQAPAPQTTPTTTSPTSSPPAPPATTAAATPTSPGPTTSAVAATSSSAQPSSPAVTPGSTPAPSSAPAPAPTSNPMASPAPIPAATDPLELPSPLPAGISIEFPLAGQELEGLVVIRGTLDLDEASGLVTVQTGDTVREATVNADGTWELVLHTGTLPQGNLTVTAQAVDSAGHTRSASAHYWVGARPEPMAEPKTWPGVNKGYEHETSGAAASGPGWIWPIGGGILSAALAGRSNRKRTNKR